LVTGAAFASSSSSDDSSEDSSLSDSLSLELEGGGVGSFLLFFDFFS